MNVIYKNWFTTGSLYLTSAIFALVLGMLASTGSYVYSVILAGFIVVPILIVYPVALLWVVLLGGLVIAGLAMLYFPQYRNISWGVVLASLLLFLRALLDGVIDRGDTSQRQLVPLLLWPVGFMLTAIVSSIVNWNGVSHFVVGLKSYFQVWGVFFAFVLIAWPAYIMEKRLPKFILWVALLQLPFAIHQYLYLVPKREAYGHGIVPADIVAGTFGASELGGGSNAVLSAFMFTVVAVLFALWKKKCLPLFKVILLSALLLSPVIVNESKVSALYLVSVFLVVWKAEIIRKPFHFILQAIVMLLVLFGMLYAYALFHATGKLRTPSELVETTIESNFGTQTGHGVYYLNRWTTIPFWAEEHDISHPRELLIGHGLRATREGTKGIDAGKTFAESKYPGIGIGLTGISALLWETGFMGLVFLLGMFVTAFRSAGVLADRYKNDPQKAGIFVGLQAGVVIMTISLFHKSSIVYDISYQTLVMLLLGYLAYYLGITPGVQSNSLDEKSHLG